MYQWNKYSDNVSLEIIVLGKLNCIVRKILTVKIESYIVIGFLSWFLNILSSMY